MLRVFVASRYAARSDEELKANIARAERACLQELLAGNAPMLPHLLYTRVLNDNVPEERALGLKAGAFWMPVVDELHVYGPTSPGVEEEVRMARALSKPVYFFKGE